MGYILFGAPAIARFHLHQQLARMLTSRGHRIAVLALDRASFDFYGEHPLPILSLRPGRPRPTHVPIDVFAEVDCARRGGHYRALRLSETDEPRDAAPGAPRPRRRQSLAAEMRGRAGRARRAIRARPARWMLRRAERALARLVDPLVRLFEVDPPDLVLLHQGRTGAHHLLHYVAREFGCHVLHTGDGMLPGTMQWDGEGIDGD
jgi:hypothetical protein